MRDGPGALFDCSISPYKPSIAPRAKLRELAPSLQDFLLLPPRRNFRGFYLYRKFARLSRKGIEIQEADAEDLQKVREWFLQLDKDPSDFRDAHVTTFIAQKKEKILGHAKPIRNLEERHPLHGYWLSSLAVGESFQEMGIGEDLTRKVIAKAEEEAAKELLLIVYEGQKAAIHLYRKLGFQIKRDRGRGGSSCRTCLPNFITTLQTL